MHGNEIYPGARYLLKDGNRLVPVTILRAIDARGDSGAWVRHWLCQDDDGNEVKVLSAARFVRRLEEEPDEMQQQYRILDGLIGEEGEPKAARRPLVDLFGEPLGPVEEIPLCDYLETLTGGAS